MLLNSTSGRVRFTAKRIGHGIEPQRFETGECGSSMASGVWLVDWEAGFLNDRYLGIWRWLEIS